MKPAIAADVALALFVMFGVLGFGWRSWLQYRRTGSSGFHGASGGAIERIAGYGFIVALATAVNAPILQRSNIVAPIGALNQLGFQVAGIAIAVIGIAATVYAQLDMGDSWRIGVDEQETTTLVHTGLFGVVRNPIYTSMFVFGFGIALVTPNPVACVGFVLLVASIELQVRCVEEPHLLRKHGDAYRAYTASAGRFVPGVGLIR
jgi:protein-S-isoprenylcysteine O-methyltransferase Ste14